MFQFCLEVYFYPIISLRILRCRKDIKQSLWFGVFFCLQKGGRKREEKRMMPEYDLEGCYCLIIAILKGVGANRARRMYEGNTVPLISKKILTHKSKKSLNKPLGKEELKQMKKMGCSYEELAEIYDCDPATIKRILKTEVKESI